MQQLGSNSASNNRVAMDGIHRFMRSLGTVEIGRVQAFVPTSELDELVSALSFVASGGQPDQKEGFLQQTPPAEELLRKYQSEAGYAFPFTHYFLEGQKQ